MCSFEEDYYFPTPPLKTSNIKKASVFKSDAVAPNCLFVIYILPVFYILSPSVCFVLLSFELKNS